MTAGGSSGSGGLLQLASHSRRNSLPRGMLIAEELGSARITVAQNDERLELPKKSHRFISFTPAAGDKGEREGSHSPTSETGSSSPVSHMHSLAGAGAGATGAGGGAGASPDGASSSSSGGGQTHSYLSNPLPPPASLHISHNPGVNAGLPLRSVLHKPHAERPAPIQLVQADSTSSNTSTARRGSGPLLAAGGVGEGIAEEGEAGEEEGAKPAAAEGEEARAASATAAAATAGTGEAAPAPAPQAEAAAAQ